MLTKKYYLRDLENHDEKHDTSIVRQLEMDVDSYVPSTGYSIQFWKDVRLYGVDEAIAYLKGHITEEQLSEIQSSWNKIKETL